jgi:pyrroloquinoline quinone biosynthesis protein D
MFPEAALKLNETATEILKLCDGERTVTQIIDALVEKFPGADRTMVEDNVKQLLTRIRTRGLLDGEND